MQVDSRTIKGNEAVEIYISATVTPDRPTKQQAQEVFSGIKEVLETHQVHIFQERVFATPEALDLARSIRPAVYGRFDDGVEPTWLVAPEGINGKIAGVQVYAVGGRGSMEILRREDKPCGRIFRNNRGAYLTLSVTSHPEDGQAPMQARKMLENAESILHSAQTDMFSVSRTWMWLNDVLSWYDDFNGIRNQFFSERGLIGNGSANKMPASTGIGIGPRPNARCAMDLMAVVQPKNALKYLDAGGNQDSALKYGSAFSRALQAASPAGKTVFISGTASIGPDGKTTHIGDAPKQIETTIKNVRAVLRDLQCRDDDVVQAIVYCKTRAIERYFQSEWSDLTWPHITAITDICRDDLLFEVEATAGRAE